LFTCIYDTQGECNKSLAYIIHKHSRHEGVHHVGCILVSETNSELKELGRKLLESASYRGFNKSTVKLLEIAQKRGDESSIEILKSRLQNDTSERYIFNSNDKTEVIEARFDSLPPTYRMNAIIELGKRYYNGNKHTVKDNALAIKYIEMYLADADKDLDRRYPMMNALKGAIIYKDGYPEKNDKLAFELMYPCRNTFPIMNYVAEAMLTGRGTKVDVDAGIALLKSCRHCHCIRYLSAYYERGKYVDADPDISFEYAKSLILEFDPEREDIKRFIRLVDRIKEEPTSIDIETCTQKKAAFLFHEAMNEEEPLVQLRLYDFSRKLGNVKAACKEANILRREYRLPKIAYSILSEYGDDKVCTALIEKYPEQDRVIVDFESELNFRFNGDKKIRFLLDGIETEIMDSYDSSFFTNRNSFEISHVFSPIVLVMPELDFTSEVMSPNEGNFVKLDMLRVNKLLILTDKPEIQLIIKEVSTNESLAKTSIRCSGSYELIGTGNLMSITNFKARFHLESNNLMKTAYQPIEKAIVEINTSGFNKIVIEEERAGAWIQCCVLNIPDLKIDPTGEFFLKIYIDNRIIGFQKNYFSGYLDDRPFIERLDSIIETKICCEEQLPRGISTSAYVRDARERIMDYICKQQDPILVNRIARIKAFDESFAYDLYLHAMRQGKDVAIAKRLFTTR